MKHTKIFSYIAIFLWILLLIFSAYFYFTHNISFEQAIFGAKSFVLENKILWFFLFIWLYCIRPLFFIIATPFDIFSWMVFGPVYGFFISWTGTFFSSMFSYGVWRITGPGITSIKRKKTKNKSKKNKKEILRKKLHEDTFFTVLMMRFLMLPFDLSNYICGIMKTPFLKFTAASTLWIAPATFIIVSAGSAFYGEEINNYETLLENIQYQNLWFASGFFATILLVSYILKKKFKDITI